MATLVDYPCTALTTTITMPEDLPSDCGMKDTPAPLVLAAESLSAGNSPQQQSSEDAPAKRKRGRPPKKHRSGSKSSNPSSPKLKSASRAKRIRPVSSSESLIELSGSESDSSGGAVSDENPGSDLSIRSSDSASSLSPPASPAYSHFPVISMPIETIQIKETVKEKKAAPTKVTSPVTSPVKRGRGRPRKYPLPATKASSSSSLSSSTESSPFASFSSFSSLPTLFSSQFSFSLPNSSFTASLDDVTLPLDDFTIATCIRDLAYTCAFTNSEQVRLALEQRFGVDLFSRRTYIFEVFNVICF